MTKIIGRNEKCPCGSGKKYKKCCLNKETNCYGDMKENKNSIKEKAAIKCISKKIVDEDGSSFYRIFWDDNIEKVNPVEYYKNYEINKRAISYRDIIEMKDPFLAEELTDDFYLRYAKEKIEEENFWKTKEQEEVPENFLRLFKTTRKKDQEALLKGLSINLDQLISLIFKSFTEYGYLYSRYRFETLPKGLDSNKKPQLADASENGIVKTIGETDMTQGQVKNMIEQRKVIIAHFFDQGDDWHCLFITYNSIDGKENWKNGQPHFHYISSAFGVTRDVFMKSMKDGQYKSTPIHIDLLGYGNQDGVNKNNNNE